ncbi:MAG TPA: hypothetical protein VEC06_10420 [Paucimonas sp.]|nr:hypothetical protein [Paucimonas sp.]
MDDDLILAAAAAIRQYLSTRPNAKDTAEGIHQWWIPWGDRPEPLAVTIAALEHLEAAGVVEHFQSGSRRLWRLKAGASSCGGSGAETRP